MPLTDNENLINSDAKYKAYIQWLECDCGAKRHGIVRLFKYPIKKLLPDGTPAKKYRWLCHFDKIGDNVTMQGTMTSPSLEGKIACMQLARDLGCKFLTLQRCKNGKLITKTFRIIPKST